jgi:penicillin-binding protein 1C
VLLRESADGLRIPVPLDRIAPAMVDATIAAEDQRFASHPGVDPIAIARAAATFRSNPSGASTITQQLARAAYLDDASPRLVRKAHESLLALQLERHRTKDEILALYLNSVYYGRAAYGVEAAARVYFGTSAQNLDVAQAAFLAGLPQLPSAYEPSPDTAAAKSRQAYVLDRMRTTGRLDGSSAANAAAEELVLVPELAPPLARHFVQFAREELAALQPSMSDRSGLVIETTIDPALQSEVERSIQRQLSDLKEKNAGNAAVVVLDPHTGALLAMAGSANFDDPSIDGQVNVALQPRQPGSALKPFLYAAALERGYTAASTLLDVPSTFATAGGAYSPMNYDRQFHGVVTLRTALASSYNVPAVRTIVMVSPRAFHRQLGQLGIALPQGGDYYGDSLALGSAEVTLLQLTNAYRALANGGRYCEVARPSTAGPREGCHAALDPRAAFIAGDILADRNARALTFGLDSILATRFWSAVKTGTSKDMRDNWAVGWSQRYTVGVWVGNAGGGPMWDVSGTSGAAPVWAELMRALHQRTPSRAPAPPPGLVHARVRFGDGLEVARQEWFIAGTEQAVFAIDSEAYCADAERAAGPIDLNSLDAAHHVPARITRPQDGTILALDPDIPPTHQRLLLQADPGAANPQALRWWIDAREVGRGPQAQWLPWPGRHVLQLRDARGTVQDERRIEVRGATVKPARAGG